MAYRRDFDQTFSLIIEKHTVVAASKLETRAGRFKHLDVTTPVGQVANDTVENLYSRCAIN
jgi:hypothetical protein